ncbi:MAG: ABC transporter ATP-binding protein [Gammaproteobacteria bacterium]|nr:ABC transporter ATP-binding protein [Gammaproteobacteria bacterium]
MSEPTNNSRDYRLFDAELSGAVLNTQLLLRLLKWMRPYWKTLGVSLVSVCITSLLAIALPIILSIVVIDHILRRQPETIAPDFGLIGITEWLATNTGWSLLFSACALYVLAQLCWAFTSHVHRMTLTRTVINGLRDLRHDVFQHLATRPFTFYDNVAVGRVMTRVTNDVESLYELLRGLGSLVGELMPFFFALAVMLAIDVEMSLILMLYVPILVVVTLVFRRYTRRLFRLVRQSVSALNQNLQENLSGLQVVQLSTREDYNLRRYRRINSNNLLFESRSMRLETLYSSFNDSVASIAIGVILWYAGGQVIQDEISLGGMILFTRFIDMLFHPIVVLGEQINILFRAMASGERIFQALDWDEANHEPEDPVRLPERLEGSLEFRNVVFGYGANTIIKDVSFSIAPGEKLAIVGATGSGKSTLIRLLSRFYDIDDNSIFLDGIDVNRIHTHDLRKRIGVVLQDFHIFSGTIYHNISLGNPDVNECDVVAAAKAANAHDFIMSLPNQYESQLAERGQNLSQGQRQLLAFARVLTTNPEILVLDEATANIDSETELLIQDALRTLTRGRTSIIIAHRLQTIQDSDRVLVLDDGRVAEMGTHDELLEAQGIYHTLHSLQFQDVA